MGNLVRELTEADFQQEVLESAVPSLVDFWGDRCIPCTMVAPILEDLAGELTGRLNFYKLKAADYPDLCARYGVIHVPTLLLFRNGKTLSRFVGAVPKPQLMKFLEPALV
jgi:thioredoxin 1